MVGGLIVFGNRILLQALWKKTLSTYNLYTFSESLIVIEYNYIFEIFWKVYVAVIWREIPRNTALLKLVRFHTWIIGTAPLTLEMFPRTSPSKRVSAIFQMWFGFFYSLVNFDIVNADVSFYKRGHNMEMQAKLNKARHPFRRSILEHGCRFSANSVRRHT